MAGKLVVMTKNISIWRFVNHIGTCMFVMSSLLYWGCGSGDPNRASADSANGSEDRLPIAFECATVEGESWRSVDQRGKPLVVTVFTSWCQPCLGILQQLDATRALPNYADQFDVVALSVDQDMNPVLEAFLNQLGVQFPVLIADAKTKHGHGPFGRILAVPTTYVLDAKGRLVDTLVGRAPIDHIVRRIKASEGEE